MGILDQFVGGFASKETIVEIWFHDADTIERKRKGEHIVEFLKKSKINKIIDELRDTGCKSISSVIQEIKEKTKNDKTISTNDIIMKLLSRGENKIASESCYADFTSINTNVGFDNVNLTFYVITKFAHIDNIDDEIIDMCKLKFKTPYGEYNQ